MADRFYSVVRGSGLPAQVTEDAATTAETIELRVNDAVYASPVDVIIGVRAILHYLETRETNPIA